MEIIRRYGCSPVGLLYIFKKPFHKNIYRGLLFHSDEDSMQMIFIKATAKLCAFFIIRYTLISELRFS